MGSQAIVHMCNVLSLVVLARILTPADFGLVAMVSAVVGFVALFKDAGLAMATVQRKQINHAQISTLFWINMGISVALAGLLVAASPLVAVFYNEPRLTWVTAALGTGFFAGGLSVQHQALLRRQMRFSVLAGTEIISQIIGHTVAIVLALSGVGFWALVYRAISVPLISALLYWFFMPWRPSLPRLKTGARSMVAFGGYLTAFNFVNYIGRNADNVLVGKYVGGEGLGIYSKAYALLLLPIRTVNSPVTAVTVPALSRLQDDPVRLANFYYKGVALLALCSMPLVTGAFAVADSLILIVLGDQWKPAIEIFRILTIPAFVGTTNVVTGWAYLSLGNVQRQFVSGTINTVLGVLAFCIGVHWGIKGVAWAFVISATVLRPPTILYCYWKTPFQMTRLLKVLWRPATSSVFAGAVTFVFHAKTVVHTIPLVAVAASVPVFLFCYVLCLRVLPGGREDLVEAIKLLKNFRSQKAESK